MGRPWLVTSCLLAAWAAAPTWAQPSTAARPVILIVESADPAVEAGPIRAALAARTGRSVVALSSDEARGARALISISVQPDGGAHLLAAIRDGAQALATSARGEGEDDPASRLSAAAAALLASLEGDESSVAPLGLLPWGAVEGRGAGPGTTGALGLLPWPDAGAAASQRRATHPEPADGLSAPTPGR